MTVRFGGAKTVDSRICTEFDRRQTHASEQQLDGSRGQNLSMDVFAARSRWQKI